MILEAWLWALVGASTSLSVVTPREPVRVYPHQTAFLRIFLQFQHPEWKYFHAKWKFLTKNCPVLYYAVKCNTDPSSANRTCTHLVEKEGPYERRVDIEKGGSLVLKDVQPEDAGKYEIHVLALDESGTAHVELVVMEGNGRDLSFRVTHQPLGATGPAEGKTAWDHSGFPTTRLPIKEGLPLSESGSVPPSAVSAAVHHTAQLSIPLQSLGRAWTFLSIKWEFTTTNGSIPVLVYLIHNCSRAFREWWERACTVHKEVAGGYQRRVDIFRNGTLVIYRVGLKDAGMYQATLRTSAVVVQATVNFTVTQGTWRSLHSENVARIVLAGLLLCFLGLLIAEHVWTTVLASPAKQVETHI